MGYTVIDKSVPLPFKYPFREMEPGDSFIVQKEDWKRAVSASIQFARNNGVKFTSRKKELRIWRVK